MLNSKLPANWIIENGEILSYRIGNKNYPRAVWNDKTKAALDTYLEQVDTQQESNVSYLMILSVLADSGCLPEEDKERLSKSISIANAMDI